ncbi:hypothetical protein [Zongyangia hominis]|uniref:Uncharacterized protein n=1 Tax=Zongyangia hominis TaxID=2763677 RepID=A0A926I9N9_9FIRM|nr:hypothetical protein [Zongyangia hominis]MBC8569356.1 hypothetical protein [Zongyangia hominis]
MSANFYRDNPDLREYYLSLPGYVQSALDASGVELTTLGELQECAEELWQEMDDTARHD